MKRRLMATVAIAAMLIVAGPALAGMDEARRWVDREFQPSTLSKEQQLVEMEWFVKAATPMWMSRRLRSGNDHDVEARFIHDAHCGFSCRSVPHVRSFHIGARRPGTSPRERSHRGDHHPNRYQ